MPVCCFVLAFWGVRPAQSDFIVGNSISLISKHIVKAFSEDAVQGATEESPAVLCATLRVFTR